MGYSRLLWVIPGYYGVLSHPFSLVIHVAFSDLDYQSTL